MYPEKKDVITSKTVLYLSKCTEKQRLKKQIVFASVLLYVVYSGTLFHPERSDAPSFRAVKFALSRALYRGSIVKVDKETDQLIVGVSFIGSVLLPAASFL